jgi:hypothetical protein
MVFSAAPVTADRRDVISPTCLSVICQVLVTNAFSLIVEKLEPSREASAKGLSQNEMGGGLLSIRMEGCLP